MSGIKEVVEHDPVDAVCVGEPLECRAEMNFMVLGSMTERSGVYDSFGRSRLRSERAAGGLVSRGDTLHEMLGI